MSVYVSYWILQTISMLITAAVLPKLRITSIFGPLMMVVAISAINATVWDAALFFSIPESATLHTLTLLASNGVMFWVLVKLLPGIEIQGIFTALVAPLIFTVCSMMIHLYAKDVDWPRIGRQAVEYVQEFRNELKSQEQTGRPN